jgi:ABC-type proline/glycine betaine transport system permease subunit
MKFRSSVEFAVEVATLAGPMQVRIDELGERSVASVAWGATSSSGLGATAREALVAALAPFGQRTLSAVMAAPVMFAASAAVLAAREAV